VFLLPAHVRHSPQRPQEGSIGLVIEPERPEGALDAIEWYCFNCQALVHRAEIDLESIVDDLPPIYNAFYEQTELRKCPECGEVHPGKVPPEGWVQL
jgi:3-hydroxyanthranilate 3,4-dioxygenase